MTFQMRPSDDAGNCLAKGSPLGTQDHSGGLASQGHVSSRGRTLSPPQDPSRADSGIPKACTVPANLAASDLSPQEEPRRHVLQCQVDPTDCGHL